MLGLPSTTEVDRRLPKEAFYGNLKLNRKTRGQFVSQVERIVIANSIKATTTNVLDGENVHEILVMESSSLCADIGACQLDVEMETGTGKTYVYTKTAYELNRLYGWTKFIVVVPSVAIREGVYKSLQATEQHFFEQYGKPIKYFIYNSSRLNELDAYSQSTDINVMIINMRTRGGSISVRLLSGTRR